MKFFKGISLFVLVLICVSALAENDHYCRAPTTLKDSVAPVNYPDQYAWQLFTEVNKQAKRESIIVGGKKIELNNAIWETWIDDGTNFPKQPNVNNPPQWPQTAQGHKLEFASFRAHSDSADLTNNAVGATNGVDQACDLQQGTCEVVYRNKTSFEYILKNNLWFQEGIAAFFKSQKQVVLPLDSIEIKGNWKLITEADKKNYHWNYTAKGELIGLVAMHFSSKIIPNWLWATFEHVDNPGRCDLLGCYDCYGTTKTVTSPNANSFGSVYAAEPLSQALLNQYAADGFKGVWLNEWKNYRLKGSMNNFTDSYGNPNLLGNSVTESGFVATSSCISCHARAAVTSEGKKAFPVFGELPTVPAVGNIPAQYGLQFITVNGTPEPADFYLRAGNLGKGNPYGTLKNLQTDFVWAIPMRAHSLKSN